MKIGIIGLGFIGQTIIQAINDKQIEGVLHAVYDIDNSLLKKTVEENRTARKMANSRDFEDCDIVIECAVQSVVKEIFDKIVEQEKYFIPLSIGAFITSSELYTSYLNLDEKQKQRIILPSGAIGGFDAIRAIMLVDIKKVTLTTRKPFHVFAKSDYIKDKNLKLNKNEENLIFSGNAQEAAKIFPKSINVAARLALATLGPLKTKVQVIADPTIDKNIHIIKIHSSTGEYSFYFQNNPSPVNPKTSWLAALSAIQTVKTLTTNNNL